MSRCARLSVWSGQNAQGEATVRLTLTITIGARAPLANTANQVFLDLVRELRAQGYTVVEAENGDAALQLAQTV